MLCLKAVPVHGNTIKMAIVVKSPVGTVVNSNGMNVRNANPIQSQDGIAVDNPNPKATDSSSSANPINQDGKSKISEKRVDEVQKSRVRVFWLAQVICGAVLSVLKKKQERH